MGEALARTRGEWTTFSRMMMTKILVGAAVATASMILVAPAAVAGDYFGHSALSMASGRYTDAGDTVTACASSTRGGFAKLSVQQADGSWVNKSAVRAGARTCNTEVRPVERENAMLRLEVCDLTDYGATQYCRTYTFSGA